jgi:hypothetical protein
MNSPKIIRWNWAHTWIKKNTTINSAEWNVSISAVSSQNSLQVDLFYAMISRQRARIRMWQQPLTSRICTAQCGRVVRKRMRRWRWRLVRSLIARLMIRLTRRRWRRWRERLTDPFSIFRWWRVNVIVRIFYDQQLMIEWWRCVCCRCRERSIVSGE